MTANHILVYLARHGTTDLNAKDAFRGPIDAPLDASGWRDANSLAHYFEPIDLSFIVHSSKIRTRETAKTIANRKEIDPQLVVENPELCAWNVGDLGGQPKDETNLAIVEHHVQNPDLPLPGGESLNDFKYRVQPLIKEAIEIALHTGVPGLMVAHSSVIHEVGTMLGNGHDYTLVEPGGVAAIYIHDGKLDAEPIFKPKVTPTKTRGETIT